MRTDVIIDRKQVICKNASHGGYDKWKAQVGDLVFYQTDSDASHVGRMIGRIQYAPKLGEDKSANGFIVAIVLSDDMAFTYERWIDPLTVTRVQSPRDHARVLQYFLGDLIIKAPVNEVRACAGEWSTLDAKRAWEAKRDADLAEYKARNPES